MSATLTTPPRVREEVTPTPASARVPTAAPATDRPERLMSLDAYRGFIMLAMASGGLGFTRVARTLDNVEPWRTLAYQFDHVPWVGCAFWDLIQPSFMFMVGVAMPYSFASRAARGEPQWKTVLHVLYRSLVLVLLGIFLSSNGARQTNFTFVNVLTQIGLGYSFLALLEGRGRVVQSVALVGILAIYWLAFVLYPVPPVGFDWLAVGAKEPGTVVEGFFAHWNKGENFAAWVDRWWMNLFPRSQPFLFNEGGYQTLNFVPSLATMIFGLMAGEWLREKRGRQATGLGLFAAGLVLLVVGWGLGEAACPLVKRIWTPSWAVFSTGWTLLMLAGFYTVIDVWGWRRWSLPLVVVGMNSIAAYVISQLMKGWVRETFKTHLGQGLFAGTYGPILESVLFLAVLWLICFWMYRRKLFLRI